MHALSRRKGGVAPQRGMNRVSTHNTPIGVVGMGLMGTSIAACLLAGGHPTTGVERDASNRRKARRRMLAFLRELKQEGLLKADPSRVMTRLSLSEGCSALEKSEVVIESITESVEAKQQVIREIEQVVSPKTLIGSNTSAIPVTTLQQGALHPERILGIHWAEPAHVTRFMEIICGKHTQPEYADRALALARGWGKEPSLLRRDIRGFIANRIMYAMLREAFYLVESGYASIDDVDRSLRNDLGYWMTFAGPFRFMDLTGIPAYAAVMQDLFPELSCEAKVPALMTKLVNSGARGVSNAKGFYHYTPAQARRWEKLFLKFTYEIRALAQKYPEKVGDGLSGKKNEL
jgi:3-hydroxybutyryl-CoA dehydrogenase